MPKAGVHEALTRRALNRAFLARQLLLERHDLSALDAVRRLLALQAQWPKPPFLALWSRLRAFDPEELKRLALEGSVVRATSMRCTIHLLDAEDHARFRPLLRPMLERAALAVAGPMLEGHPIEKPIAEAKKLLARAPLTFEAIRDALAPRFPKADIRGLGYVIRTHVPLVLAPEADSRWGWPAAAKFALMKEARPPPVQELIRRYLAAFGPATVADFQNWSGLKEAKGAFEPLRGELRMFSDPKGRELFDLPAAPRPPEDVEAPVRLLPEFDSVVLGHADRSRALDDAFRKLIFRPNLRVVQTFLVDGFVAGTWLIERKKRSAAVTLSPLVAVRRADQQKLAKEAERAGRFFEPDAESVEVRWQS